MSAGEIAGLVAAIAFAVLVLLLAVPILKLGRTADETTKMIAGVSERTLPLISDLDLTVRQVNGQLEAVDAITENAAKVTTNVAGLTSLFAATLGSPVVKVAAFSYGVRTAATKRRRGEVSHRVAQEMKAERRSGPRGRRRR